MNPLSDVMGGWGIWETVNGEQKLTTECIENVIMMVPFSAVAMWTFEEKIGNGWKNSFDLVRETVISLNIDFVIAIAQSSIPHNSEAGFVIAFDQGVHPP